MARIVSPPIEKHVKCNACGATIAYLPEEVRHRKYSCMGESCSDDYIMCPREGCPGEGIIRSL